MKTTPSPLLTPIVSSDCYDTHTGGSKVEIREGSRIKQRKGTWRGELEKTEVWKKEPEAYRLNSYGIRDVL